MVVESFKSKKIESEIILSSLVVLLNIYIKSNIIIISEKFMHFKLFNIYIKK